MAGLSKSPISLQTKVQSSTVKSGGKNTKYFHSIATAHKRFNAIGSLEVEGQTINDPAARKENIPNFYLNLYKESENWRPDFNLDEALGITNEEQEWLQRQFEEEKSLVVSSYVQVNRHLAQMDTLCVSTSLSGRS